MLKDKDRIFQNLYNDLGSDIISAQKRGDWVNTKEIISKGRDWIINEVKGISRVVYDISGKPPATIEWE